MTDEERQELIKQIIENTKNIIKEYTNILYENIKKENKGEEKQENETERTFY